ncbi:MAG: hypothetical protein JNM55_10765 [Anaerolineales bacterium]|nr:hypothetical protein [Anaerolineales bacterium]
MDRFRISVAVFAFSLAILACGAVSSPSVPAEPAATGEIPVVITTSQPQATAETSSPVPAITEARRLTLEYPPKMRAGVESEIIRLTLEVDELGNITPTAHFEGNVITGDVIDIPNIYETHNVTVEARLDLAGVDVSPSGATFEPLQPGKPATFYWSIRPQNAGTYRGTAWLHLNFVNKLTGEESRIAVSAQVVEIEAVDFFGLSVNVARTSGVLGSIVGGVLGFPFLEDIIKFVVKKRKSG